MIEYTVILIILMGAFLAVQHYFKRGLQGRWKMVVDDLGDQYDPKRTNGSVLHTIVSNTDTVIITMNDATGFWTKRVDTINSIDSKTGFTAVGGY